MSASPDGRSFGNSDRWLQWLPVLIGLGAIVLPTFYNAAGTIWQSDDNAHGPIILVIVVWLFWRDRAVLLAANARAAPAAGIALLMFGLTFYVVGRSQDIAIFEFGALAPVLAGALIAMRGWPAVRALWFPLLFVVFMVPLPGFFVDALTGPLKQQVSEFAADILYAAGYPIARSGVVLTIGQYQLLVADACSGLHSIISLIALGLLFMYLTARHNLPHNMIMLAGILPIAFMANLARVIILMLVTYHFGDEAGQGFLHGAAGIVLFVVSLIALFLLDAILARMFSSRALAQPPVNAPGFSGVLASRVKADRPRNIL